MSLSELIAKYFSAALNSSSDGQTNSNTQHLETAEANSESYSSMRIVNMQQNGPTSPAVPTQPTGNTSGSRPPKRLRSRKKMTDKTQLHVSDSASQNGETTEISHNDQNSSRKTGKKVGKKKTDKTQLSASDSASQNGKTSESNHNEQNSNRKTGKKAELKMKNRQNDDQRITVVGLLLRILVKSGKLVVKVEEEPLKNKVLIFSFHIIADDSVPLLVEKTKFLLGCKLKHDDPDAPLEDQFVIVMWANVQEYIELTSFIVRGTFRSISESTSHEEIVQKLYFSWRPFLISLLKYANRFDQETIRSVLLKILPRDRRCLSTSSRNHQLRFQEVIGLFSSPESLFLHKLGEPIFREDEELVKYLIELVTCSTKSLDPVRHLLRLYYSCDPEGLLALIDVSAKGLDPSTQSLASQNFRDLPLIPVSEELKGVISSLIKGFSKDPTVNSLLQLESHLVPNRIDGPWDSSEEFLNVHFRLLREECFASIRDRIASIRVEPKKDQQVHREVKVIGYAVSDGTIVARIRYLPHKSRSNLMYGNLLCIDVDTQFNNPIWATVKNAELKIPVISIVLVGVGNNYVSGNNKIDTDSVPSADVLVAALQRLIACKSGVMVESPTYYNAFRPVLARLQTLSEGDFPFASEILLKSVEPQNTSMDFKCFLDSYKLDESQKISAIASITQRFSLIQGPPGCGKTFVGKEIVRAMLKSEKCNGPILLMTYKNHALDSFLESCLEFTKSLVRIGGRSSSDTIAKYNLHNIIDQEKSSYPQEDFKKLKDARGQLQRLAMDVEESAAKSLVDITASELLSFLLERGMIGKEHVLSLLMKNFEDNYNNYLNRESEIKHKIKYLSPEDVERAVIDILNDSPDLAAKLLKMSLDQWLSESEAQKLLPKPQRSLFINIAPGKKVIDDDEELEDMPLEEDEIEQMVGERVVGSESKLQYKEISNKKRGLYPELLKRMSYIEPDERESDVSEVEDLWSLSGEGRYVLLTSWLREWRKAKDEHLSKTLEQYNRYYQQVQELEDARSVAFLKSRDLVACTITGCCLKIGVISQLAPSVVIVEEAAEILESQLIASLPSSVKHLVLIGDHQQLPPQVHHHRLAKRFNLGVSIFERLAKNKYPVSQLQYHRRGPQSLCPLFSRFYNQKIIAPKEDPKPPDALKYLGLMYWWNHEAPAQLSSIGMSYENGFEAAMLVGAVRLLTWKNQIEAKRITIITGYLGQAKLIKKLLLKDEIEGITVCTIDRYQGDENDFIFLSLTRSVNEKTNDDKKPSLGFLASPNRTCVALSRARIGLYIFGCSTLFETHPSWKAAVEYFQNKKKLGRELQFHLFGKMLAFEHPHDFSLLFEKLKAEDRNWKMKLQNQFIKELPPQAREGIHDVTAAFGKKIEELMHNSILNFGDLGVGRDADGKRFRRFKVTKVSSIFNKDMYLLYRHHQKIVESSKPPPLGFEVDTKADWTNSELNKKVNEVFLFHGTRSDIFKIIAESGFDERVANNGMYGAGIYFAENADKSDHYTSPGAGGVRFMFLARVTLGRPYETEHSGSWRRPPPINEANPTKLYDSIIAVSRRKGGAHAANYRHQEFILFDRYQCLPEFIIEYSHQ